MSPSEVRSSKFAKSDLMRVEHVKIPESVLATLTVEATRRDRHRSYLIRELLATAAAAFRVKHAEEAAAGRGGKRSAA